MFLENGTLDPDFMGTSGDTEMNAAALGSGLVKKKPLNLLRKMLEDYRSTNETNSMQGLIDYDYYDGKQLTSAEVEKLRSRGQPDIVVNRTKVAINGILGIIAQSHTDPKAWPRTPTENDSASVATDVLRFVVERVRFNDMKVELGKDNLIGGACAAIVTSAGDKHIAVSQVRWEEFFYDPRSRKPDFSDARYMGIAKWMYADDVERMYPVEARDMASQVTSVATGGISVMDEVMSDRPVNQGWLDYRNNRVMVVEVYYREKSNWVKNVFWYGGVLEEGPSPYKDQYGNDCNPIIAQSCYVDRDNKRYGVVRDMRDLQDEINKRRSKLLHIINSSQVQARDPSAIEVDADTARQEAARPDGVLPYGWEKVPTSDMSQGQMLLLTEAKNEMERFGPNPAVLGRQGADTSGRALLARQQAGLVELAVILNQLENFEVRIYRSCWERVQQFWTGEQYVRVTHDPESPKFVAINKQTKTPNPKAGQPIQGTNVGEWLADPETGQPQLHPDHILGYENQVAEMDVDIVIDTTPATASIMQEQVKDLMSIVASNPSYADQVPFEIFVDLMPIPRKSQIIKQIQQFRDQKQQAAAKQQQELHEIALAQGHAKTDDMTTKADLNHAKAVNLIGGAKAEAIRTSNETAETLHNMQVERNQADNDRYRVIMEKDALDAGKTENHTG